MYMKPVLRWPPSRFRSAAMQHVTNALTRYSKPVTVTCQAIKRNGPVRTFSLFGSICGFKYFEKKIRGSSFFGIRQEYPQPCPVQIRNKNRGHLWACLAALASSNNRKKRKVTLGSRLVSHASTNSAQRCLTSLIGREAVFPTWYEPCMDAEGRFLVYKPCQLITVDKTKLVYFVTNTTLSREKVQKKNSTGTRLKKGHFPVTLL